MNLYNKLVNQEIKSPIAIGFNLESWLNEKVNSNRDFQLKFGGYIIFSILDGIRKELKEIENKIDEYNTDQLFKEYIKILNSSHINLVKKVRNTNLKNRTIQNITYETSFGNHLTIDDISECLVDTSIFGLTSLLEIKNSRKKEIDDEGRELMAYIKYLSELYSIYENLWIDLFHEHKEFCMDKDNLDITFKDIDNTYTKSWIDGKYRVSRNELSSKTLAFSEIQAYENFGIDIRHFNKMITIDKNKKICIQKSSNICNYIKSSIYIDYRKFKSCEIWDTLPKLRSIEKDMLELFEVFLQIKSLAYSIQETSLNNNSNLETHSYFLSLKELKDKISEATGISKKSIEKHIKFLTFSKKSDIWSKPLLVHENVKPKFFQILIASCISPNVSRILEIWLKEKGWDLSEKGLGFESHLNKVFLNSIEGNALINKEDYNVYSSKEIKINGKTEEIDLIIKVGELIILAELKNNSYPYDTRSYYRCLDYIEKGCDQIKRKKEFVKANLEEFFIRMNWSFNKDKEYQIKELVLVNNSIGVGRKIYDVFIQDKKSLSSYLNKNKFDIISNECGVFLERSCYCTLYNNYQEFLSNFDTYLENYPGMYFIINTPLKYISNKIPYFNGVITVNMAGVGDINNANNICNHLSNLEKIFKINNFPKDIILSDSFKI